LAIWFEVRCFKESNFLITKCYIRKAAKFLTDVWRQPKLTAWRIEMNYSKHLTLLLDII
jgi:hypothetical protein